MLNTEDATHGQEGAREFLPAKEEPAHYDSLEERYRSLSEMMGEGFTLCELVRGADGRVCDFRMLELNAAFEELTGVPRDQALGRLASEVFPGQDQSFFEIYGRVDETREPAHVQNYVPSNERWYDVRMLPRGAGIVAALYEDITQQKRTEAALRASEQRLQRVLETDAVGILFFDKDGTLIHANDVFLRMSGYTRHQIDRHELTWRKMTPPEWLAESETQMQRFSHSGRVGPYEKEYFLADGSRRWMLFAGRDLGDGSMVEYAIDVHERKLAEAALRQSQERQAFLLKLSDTLRPLTDPLQIQVEASRLLGQHLGASRAAYGELETGQDGEYFIVRQDYHAQGYPSAAGRFRATDFGEVIFDGLRSGRCFIVSDTATDSRFTDEMRQRYAALQVQAFMVIPLVKTGRLVAALGVHRSEPHDWALEEVQLMEEAADRTWAAVERARAEHQFAATNQKLNEILESIQDDFYVLDRNWVFVFTSRSFTSKIGKEPADFIGRNIWEMFPKHVGGLLYRNFHATMEQREIRRFEIPGNYTNAWYRMTSFPSADGITVLGTDITQRKQVEEALRENQKQLQLLNETLEQKVQDKTAEVRQLAADLTLAAQRERQRISHVLHDDLQQRVYAIQVQLSFLRDALNPGSEAARNEASDMEGKLDEILEITRQLSIDLSPPILRGEGLTQAIGWLAGRMQDQYRLPIAVEADGPFIIPEDELHVLLFNCVRELLFNVVKHAAAGRAAVRLQWSGPNIQIEVEDDGRGFRPDLLEEGGSGDVLQASMGLPTIRHQLSLFGGTIDIHSKPGAGTRVVLEIPVSSAA